MSSQAAEQEAVVTSAERVTKKRKIISLDSDDEDDEDVTPASDNTMVACSLHFEPVGRACKVRSVQDLEQRQIQEAIRRSMLVREGMRRK